MTPFSQVLGVAGRVNCADWNQGTEKKLS